MFSPKHSVSLWSTYNYACVWREHRGTFQSHGVGGTGLERYEYGDGDGDISSRGRRHTLQPYIMQSRYVRSTYLGTSCPLHGPGEEEGGGSLALVPRSFSGSLSASCAVSIPIVASSTTVRSDSQATAAGVCPQLSGHHGMCGVPLSERGSLFSTHQRRLCHGGDGGGSVLGRSIV